MKASEAREIYFNTHISSAMESFYDVIRKQAPFGLSGNFYETATLFDYAILRVVAAELESQGYRVDYSDGEINRTKIFRVSWEE